MTRTFSSCSSDPGPSTLDPCLLSLYNVPGMSFPEHEKQNSKAGVIIRLLAVSDVVEPQLYNNSVKDWIGPVDVLISCGDLPPYYLDFLASSLDVPLYHVLGNHCYVPH